MLNHEEQREAGQPQHPSRKPLLEDGMGWLRKRTGLVAAWDFTTWVCSLSLSLPPT